MKTAVRKEGGVRFLIVCVTLFVLCGCTADVQTTEDSNRITVETPKVETSGQTPDLDPTTDGDVDIDTPLPGDR